MEGRPLDDDDLAERACAGDVRAFADLLRRYETISFRLAFLLTGSASEAEEAAQSAFVKAYYALPRFRVGAPFRPWLLAIVGNEARNRRRSGRRAAALVTRAAEDRPQDDAAPSPEEAVLASTRRTALLDAVRRLPPRHRDVVMCRYFLEMSEAETAAVLGCAAGTVKSRLARALSRLRASLPGDDAA